MAVRVLWLVFGVLLVSALSLTVFLSAQQLASAPLKEEEASKEQIEQEDPKNKAAEDKEVVTEKDQQPKSEASKDSGVSGEPQAPKYYEQPVYEQLPKHYEQPVYEQAPKHYEQPVYEQAPKYYEQPTYGVPKNQWAPQW